MSYGQYATGDRLQGAYFTRGDAPKVEQSSKRQKHVFNDNREIAHLWFHGAYGNARNPRSNFYFSGDTIYSYGSHFPIARLVKNKAGNQAVLMTTRKYSPTTAKHIRTVWSAIRVRTGDAWVPAEGWQIFNVPEPTDFTHSQLAGYQSRITELGKTVLQSRIREKTKAERFSKLVLLVTEANDFAKFTGVKKRFAVPANVEVLSAELGKIVKREEQEKKRRQVAQEKEWKWQTAKQREEYQSALKGWLAGEQVYLPRNPDGNREAYLRVNPVDSTVVETSQGARFPVSHARRAVRFIRLLTSKPTCDCAECPTCHVMAVCAKCGKCASCTEHIAGCIGCAEGRPLFVRNGHSIRLGHYAVDKIEADGTIRAGCHVVTRAEFEKIAGVLDSMPVEASETEETETEQGS